MQCELCSCIWASAMTVTANFVLVIAFEEMCISNDNVAHVRSSLIVPYISSRKHLSYKWHWTINWYLRQERNSHVRAKQQVRRRVAAWNTWRKTALCCNHTGCLRQLWMTDALVRRIVLWWKTPDVQNVDKQCYLVLFFIEVEMFCLWKMTTCPHSPKI